MLLIKKIYLKIKSLFIKNKVSKDFEDYDVDDFALTGKYFKLSSDGKTLITNELSHIHGVLLFKPEEANSYINIYKKINSKWKLFQTLVTKDIDNICNNMFISDNGNRFVTISESNQQTDNDIMFIIKYWKLCNNIYTCISTNKIKKSDLKLDFINHYIKHVYVNFDNETIFIFAKKGKNSYLRIHLRLYYTLNISEERSQEYRIESVQTLLINDEYYNLFFQKDSKFIFTIPKHNKEELNLSIEIIDIETNSFKKYKNISRITSLGDIYNIKTIHYNEDQKMLYIVNMLCLDYYLNIVKLDDNKRQLLVLEEKNISYDIYRLFKKMPDELFLRSLPTDIEIKLSRNIKYLELVFSYISSVETYCSKIIIFSNKKSDYIISSIHGIISDIKRFDIGQQYLFINKIKNYFIYFDKGITNGNR